MPGARGGGLVGARQRKRPREAPYRCLAETGVGKRTQDGESARRTGRSRNDVEMTWQAYLSGEIHTDWRERVERGAAAAGLDIRFTAPVTDHAASDAAGMSTHARDAATAVVETAGRHI